MLSQLTAFAIRWRGPATVFGGLAYLVLHWLLEANFPDHWAGSPDRVLGWGYADYSRLLWIPSALLLLGLTGMFERISRGVGWLGRLGFGLACLGFGLDILGNIVEFWVFGVWLVPFAGEFRTGSAGSQLGYAVSSFGALFLIAGLLLLGIASLRSNLPQRWRFLPFAIGLIYATILPSYFAGLLAAHAIAFGLCWICLAFYLWKDKDVLAPQPGSEFTRQAGGQ